MKNSRAILLLLLANSISGVAQGISMLAIPWYFTSVIYNETLFGKVYFTAMTVSLFWGTYVGALVDRHPRKKIFLVINVVGFFVLGTVTAWGFAHGFLPWWMVALVFANTMLIYNIHFPNLYAYAQEITPKSEYARVTSLLEIQGQLTFTLAGAGAAILLKGIDHHLNVFGIDLHLPFYLRPLKIYEIFSFDAATYLIAFLIIYRIRSLPVVDRAVDTGTLYERLKTGFNFLYKHKVIMQFGIASLLLFLTIIVFGTYVQPAYVASFLHQGGDVYAFGDMSFSFGALVAGFVTTRVFSEKQAIPGIIILHVLAGIMYVSLVLHRIPVLFFAANFITGSCNAAVRIQRITYIFHHVPNRVIGRSGSIFFVTNVFMRVCLIGLFTLPFFHAGSNIQYAILIMAAICFVAALFLGANYKKLMHEPGVA
ncbi:MAG TPA: MFS transporter [Chitinophagales bacterium]|nr:MFS transporter [Chitinophagales bacterium]